MHENGGSYHPARQCRGSGSRLSACHEAGRDSLSGSVMDVAAVGEFLSAYVRFALSVSFHRCSILMHSPITDPERAMLGNSKNVVQQLSQ